MLQAGQQLWMATSFIPLQLFVSFNNCNASVELLYKAGCLLKLFNNAQLFLQNDGFMLYFIGIPPGQYPFFVLPSGF